MSAGSFAYFKFWCVIFGVFTELFCLLQQHVKKKLRVKVMEYWIETARECFNIGNFNSLMAIIAGLNMSPISRLKKTVSQSVTFLTMVFPCALVTKPYFMLHTYFLTYLFTLLTLLYLLTYLLAHLLDLLTFTYVFTYLLSYFLTCLLYLLYLLTY